MGKRSNKALVIGVVALIIIIVVTLLVIIVVRHKNTNNTATLTPAQVSTAKQQIEGNWKTFFAASTSLQTREHLLQNGSEFSQSIKSEFSALGSQASTAEVGSISLINSSSANVVYTVELNGQPVLTDQKGEALLINNTWVVSDSTLCGLLGLAGNKPSVCQNV